MKVFSSLLVASQLQLYIPSPLFIPLSGTLSSAEVVSMFWFWWFVSVVLVSSAPHSPTANEVFQTDLI